MSSRVFLEFLVHSKSRSTDDRLAHSLCFIPEEDSRLEALVGELGATSWPKVAVAMPGRTARQCRDRWSSYLSSDAKAPWTPEEEALLLAKMGEFGRQWVRFSKAFVNRSDLTVKRGWTAISRQQHRCCAMTRCSSLGPELGECATRTALIQKMSRPLPPKRLELLAADPPSERVAGTGEVTVRIFARAKNPPR
jgi:hypothetical protein